MFHGTFKPGDYTVVFGYGAYHYPYKGATTPLKTLPKGTEVTVGNIIDDRANWYVWGEIPPTGVVAILGSYCQPKDLESKGKPGKYKVLAPGGIYCYKVTALSATVDMNKDVAGIVPHSAVIDVYEIVEDDMGRVCGKIKQPYAGEVVLWDIVMEPKEEEDIVAQSIWISVKMITGKEIGLEVNSNEKVLKAKEQIEKMEGIPPSKQRLLLDGVEMNDRRKIAHYNVTKNSVIFLVLKAEDTEPVESKESNEVSPEGGKDTLSTNDVRERILDPSLARMATPPPKKATWCSIS